MDLFESLGRDTEATLCHVQLAIYALNVGDVETVRRNAHQGLKTGTADLDRSLLLLLCQTWIHDPTPEALEWAERYLDAWGEAWLDGSAEDAHLGMFLRRVGMAERIYRDSGRHTDFQERLERQRQRLESIGRHTEGIWSFQDAPVPLRTLSPTPPTPDWEWIPGDPNHDHVWKDELVLVSRPLRGFLQMDMPRLMRPVAGDFALQATLPGAERIMPEILRCRHRAATDSLAEQALGGGGLLLMRQGGDALRLFVHLHEPGEVICTLRQGNADRTLGRGLLPDGPVRLRLERTGDLVRAYAGEASGRWHLCAEVALPGWEVADVGLYGECLIPLYSIVERCETRFADVCLESRTGRRGRRPDPGEPYPLPEPVYDPDVSGFVAAGKRMQKLMKNVRRAARTDWPVLILGETGTGKEHVARALHQFSPRSHLPFITVNCAAISPDLLERELFGHIRGAYTGAHEDRAGLFEAAQGGTLFLDEIGEASPAFQARLLRVIEENAIRRVGDTRLRPVRVRVIAATNRPLEHRVQQGAFRRDLYYRLRGEAIELPPLVRRREEIPALVHHALRLWADQHGADPPPVTYQAMEILLDHDWPGNVRELVHEIARAASAAGDGLIDPRALSIRSIHSPSALSASSREDEVQRITQALQKAGGNRSEAARRLGISRVTLYRRIHRLGLDRLLS